jgi:hypothetical protein
VEVERSSFGSSVRPGTNGDLNRPVSNRSKKLLGSFWLPERIENNKERKQEFHRKTYFLTQTGLMLPFLVLNCDAPTSAFQVLGTGLYTGLGKDEVFFKILQF